MNILKAVELILQGLINVMNLIVKDMNQMD